MNNKVLCICLSTHKQFFKKHLLTIFMIINRVIHIQYFCILRHLRIIFLRFSTIMDFHLLLPFFLVFFPDIVFSAWFSLSVISFSFLDIFLHNTIWSCSFTVRSFVPSHFAYFQVFLCLLFWLGCNVYSSYYF